MMKAMISQPMDGRTYKEIRDTKERATNELEKMGYDIVDTFFGDVWHNAENLSELRIKNIPLYYLAKSIEKMSECDAVYFCEGWSDSRGCRIEHTTAFNYGLKTLYEESNAEV